MIPVRDVIPSRTTPWVNIILIAGNAIVFLYECVLTRSQFLDVVSAFGLVPAHFSWTTATTSMFVHENFLHLSSNLLVLWIFGDNVEDQLGHGRYFIFYLMAGWIAALTEVWASPFSTVPLIGASGAIAGVMGAYFVMFPRSRVLVLIPVDVVEIPAVMFPGIWFMLQIAGGLGRPATNPFSSGGTAVWAHIGGFVTGLVAVRVLRRPERKRVEWWSAQPDR